MIFPTNAVAVAASLTSFGIFKDLATVPTAAKSCAASVSEGVGGEGLSAVVSADAQGARATKPEIAATVPDALAGGALAESPAFGGFPLPFPLPLPLPLSCDLSGLMV